MNSCPDTLSSLPIQETPSKTLEALYREGLELLTGAGVSNATNETLWLLQSALQRSRLGVFVEHREEIGPEQWTTAWDFLVRRTKGEPLQYILGTQEFCGLDLATPRGVLIPRPETELVVQEVLHHQFSNPHPIMIDMGTGSGCLAVALAVQRPDAIIWGTDCCAQAVAAATLNVAKYAVSERVTCVEGSFFEPLHTAGLDGQVSVIVSNPPYIPTSDVSLLPLDVRGYEPWLALDGGPEGLDFFRPILQKALTFLHPGGILVLEMGKGQASHVCRDAKSIGGYGVHRIIRDASHIERVICFERKA